MKKIIFTALLCLSYIVSHAQESTLLHGQVTNRDTGTPIPHITISVPGTTLGTVTNEEGRYEIRGLAPGRGFIRASAVGYEPERIRIELAKGESRMVDFEMSESTVQIDDIVVSANRSESKRKNAPALVGIIGPQVFELTNSACLAQGLNFQPGVRIEDDCQNCGFLQVRMNGLDGHYSQILLDSKPVFSALTGVYGLEQIPSNMIRRVEVMRGGGSALFGASAIGGTINIITKDPDRNSGEASHTITGIGRGGSYDNVTSAGVSLVTNSRKAGLYLYGQNRNRTAYDADGDGFSEIPELSSQSMGLNSYYRTGDHSRLTLLYNSVTEYRRGGDLLDLPPHQAMIAETTDHKIHGGSLAFDISDDDYTDRGNAYVSFQNTQRKSYYGSHQDPNAYGRTHDLTVAAGAQYVHGFHRLWFMPADLTIGLEYTHNGLDDESIGYDIHTDQEVHIAGLYLQNEWKNDHWSLLIGGRLDKHNLVRRVIFSPRANLRYNPTEEVSLRLSYGSGYRAPQAFDEDLHVAIVGGERTRIRLADNLRQERSQSVSLSADMYHTFGRVRTNLMVEGFFTTLDDVFALRTIGTDPVDGATIKERYNGSGATVMGINIEAKAALSKWFDVQAGVTIQRSRYKEPEYWSEDASVPPSRKMFRTPDTYGFLTAQVTPVRRFTVSATGTYTGRMLMQHAAGFIPQDTAVTTPSFFDLGLKISYDIPLYREITMQLYAGVQNIFNAYQRDFDQGPERDSGYMYGPSLPRSWNAGLKISF